MDLIHAIILGIVEGITEFLPISSTFHLIFAAKYLGLEETEFLKAYQVVIQAGGIFAAVLLYWKDVWNDRSLIWKTAAAFIPTGIIAFALSDIIKGVFFESEVFMLAAFLAVGFIFILVEWIVKLERFSLRYTIATLTYKHALLIGALQALAVLPGVSRAGSVIVVMMLLRYQRSEAARFSFLLAIPTIMAAAAHDAFKMRETFLTSTDNLAALAVGTIVSFITAYVVMKWFILFLQKNTLIPFAIYRFVAVIIILLTLELSP
ncbi:MAG: undecaprenyl-diphosphate phosphatase [Patescibacteria group bacterium]|nr:undecaprenyl-diphosphate phosphatase [Patescibacteria group bacterium]